MFHVTDIDAKGERGGTEYEVDVPNNKPFHFRITDCFGPTRDGRTNSEVKRTEYLRTVPGSLNTHNINVDLEKVMKYAASQLIRSS